MSETSIILLCDNIKQEASRFRSAVLLEAAEMVAQMKQEALGRGNYERAAALRDCADLLRKRAMQEGPQQPDAQAH